MFDHFFEGEELRRDSESLAFEFEGQALFFSSPEMTKIRRRF